LLRTGNYTLPDASGRNAGGAGSIITGGNRPGFHTDIAHFQNSAGVAGAPEPDPIG